MPEIFKKLKDILLGIDAEDEDVEEGYDYNDEEEAYDKPRKTVRPVTEIKTIPPRDTGSRTRGSANNLKTVSTGSNVIDLHKKSQIDIVMPKSVEDARDVIDNTKSGIISVVNLEGVDGAQAQRIADFLSGSVDALDGTIRRLGYDMFVIAPKGVEITGSVSMEINSELKSFGVSPSSWLSPVFK